MRASGWVMGCFLVMLGSCGFPQIEFERNVPLDGGGEISDEGKDAAPSEEKASVAAAGTQAIRGMYVCTGSDPCDCDGDGYVAKSATCGGNDCDDSNPNVHPKQEFVDEAPASGKSGDWDCNDTIEKQYVIKLDCKTLLGLECSSSAQGFVDDPPCGVLADYYQCAPSLLACAPAKMGQRRQACR